MIIGITGPLGAGKGTIAEYLNKKHNVIYLSVRSFFAEEVLKRGQIATRDNITTVARDLRTEKGPTYALEQLLARAGTGGRGTVIESIRTVAEAEFLKSKGASLWCVQADVEARYKRFIGKAMPQDAMTHEQFIEKDKQDMDASDPANQDLAAVCQMASTGLDNSGSKEELFAQVEEALKKI
ncbi:hypothetical protein A3F55_01425 [Candidatus Adlerbacteria bacterium RIFCSPHIGHO2_12_FULL_53_18]|uniref:Dephospho-CoA kinase n=1 Tax=Candidatus Adlerbacteria bacterium RIFCSPHIGHO2_12_FULL_53_18 TaxID=1797242 RepID=A0A1F4XU66_9BACT|nr:MAG: hypothetical protein A3F55_01425 [Candidatus Adlerbacteria bacterium RIFCSPHIGHO2_12_FULL_53_18]